MSDNLKVMLTTEGTYPFHQGGVSTWCDILVKRLPEVEYVIYSIIMNPFVTQKFALPGKTELIRVPLWGTEEPSEHLTTPFSQVYLGKRKTDEKVIKEHFIPLFQSLIYEIISPVKNHQQFGHILADMHKYFQDYDYKNSFKAEASWNVFKRMILPYTTKKMSPMDEPCLFSLNQSLGWIYRFLTILNTPIPKVDVTHSAAAAFCGIPCVLAKIHNGTPFLLTEHGVYLREQYLSLAQRGYSSYLNTFLMRMIHSIAGLNYSYADQVSPVCNYNTRWEKEYGVPEKRIKVIYNGVDNEVYSPSGTSQKNKYPTVVAVARIDPVKDLLTMIKCAAVVRERIPEVRFLVYGTVSVPQYYEECKQLVAQLNLTQNFIFAGHTDDVPTALRSGDIIALSSISEAFPYSVVEAMMTGKAVVATDVGGIKEALGETGIIVRPRVPEELANAIITLFENPDLRLSLGEEARERALNYFTIERVLKMYLDSYKDLAGSEEEAPAANRKLGQQRLLIEKGYALSSFGLWFEAIEQLRKVIKLDPESAVVPVLLTEIANIYNILGKYDNAFLEMEKAEAFIKLMNEQKIA